jgi:hypothetical protein
MPWLGEADRRRHTKLLVREVISIAPVSADGMHVTWDTASYVALLQRAQREQLVLGIAHSHPKGGLIHYSSLSAVRDRRKVARASNLARPEKAEPRDGKPQVAFRIEPRAARVEYTRSRCPGCFENRSRFELFSKRTELV